MGRTGGRMNNPIDGLIGALGFFACCAISIALGARFVPVGTPITPLARIFDSLAPWLLVAAILAAISVTVLGAKGIGTVLLLAAAGVTAMHVTLHLRTSQSLAAGDGDLRVLFFNVLEDNSVNAGKIAEFVLELDPDIAIFAESEALAEVVPVIATHLPHHTECPLEDYPESCQLMVFSKEAPVRQWYLDLNQVWEKRYVVSEFTLGDTPFYVAGVHRVKPWFSGIAEEEQGKIIAQLNWLKGPSLVMGDFNAAPWSRSLSRILRATGFKSPRLPVPSWPASAGAFGVPIDQALVRGGMRIVALEAVGEGLGSNHRGLLATIKLPD